jgi:hypothetical protein
LTDDAIERAGLAELDAAFGAEWDLWHDRGGGLWWAWSEQRRVRLAADSADGLAALLAELGPPPGT